jgi:hypothetical protein
MSEGMKVYDTLCLVSEHEKFTFFALRPDALMDFEHSPFCAQCETAEREHEMEPQQWCGRGEEGDFTEYECSTCGTNYMHVHDQSGQNSVRWTKRFYPNTKTPRP